MGWKYGNVFREISVKQYDDIVLGKYGGNISAGAKRMKTVR